MQKGPAQEADPEYLFMTVNKHNVLLSPAPASAAAESVTTAERATAAEATETTHVHAAHWMMPAAETAHVMMMPPAHRRTMIPVTVPRTADCPNDPNENDQSQHFKALLSQCRLHGKPSRSILQDRRQLCNLLDPSRYLTVMAVYHRASENATESR